MSKEATNLSDAAQLLCLWRDRVRTNQKTHYNQADRLTRRARWWNAAAAVLSASIGVLILVTARYDTPAWMHFVTGGLSILSAAIATINASQKPAELAAQHHAGGAAYGAVLRQIEEALALPPQTEEAMRTLIKELREKLDAIPITAPTIPGYLWPKLPRELTPLAAGQAQQSVPADSPASAALRQDRV